MEDIERSSILDTCMGGIKELVDYEVGNVIKNIMDPNTKAAAKRTITVTLELTPDDSRRTISLASSSKSKLVPTNPVTTALYVTGDPSTGEMEVVEMVPQIPGQTAMNGGEQEEPKVLKFARQA